jgi:NAD(P)-dependent dehydrogenase (short-subunit alcohol dehydrogenase family)
MQTKRKTMIVTGAAEGIGAGVTNAFIERDTAQDIQKLPGTNLPGYFDITQLAAKRMLMQNGGRSVTCVISGMAHHPTASSDASPIMVTKGGLQAIARSLAMQYAKEGIRFNAVAYARADAPAL